MAQVNSFQWRHLEAAILLLCGRWYLRYSLSYRDLEELLAERGLPVDPTTLLLWGQRDAPEFAPRVRAQLKPTPDSCLAGRRGVTIEPASVAADLQAFYDLSTETASRDEFGIHILEYYRDALTTFSNLWPPAAMLLLAYHPDFGETPIAGLMAFAFGREAFYLYGASSDRGREHMPNHLLQWEAMNWARGRGCTSYDFGGIPDEPEEEAPEEGENPNVRRGLWGVYRFKQGFGGREFAYTGAWDHVYHPLLYRLYSKVAARGIRLKRET